MGIEKQFVRVFTALLLLTALMLPNAIQLSHVFQGHEHQVCKEQVAHVHEQATDCQICHFHQSTYHYSVTNNTELLLPTVLKKEACQFSSPLFSSFKHTNTQLRAPPYLLG
ncbi:hypothetical protein [Sediminicola sp. 1XM1-17]|uniref:hypothetical protein n=1 Tax=Sediminicola sp. 1XM1-17 TaxID=3127702 RepID=UPI0030774300